MPHNVSDTLERSNSFPSTSTSTHPRKQSQHSIYAKKILMSKIARDGANATAASGLDSTKPAPAVLPPAAIDSLDGADGRKEDQHLRPRPQTRFAAEASSSSKDGVGAALSDTPAPSPRL
jgi:hypothetical protein